ncbi:MAG: hypothetical protein GY941_03105 [Planctomycetes bacterium]|nr:hypothetical protein [Planctomycetota bacterium]
MTLKSFFTKKALYVFVPLALSILLFCMYFHFDDLYFGFNPKRATFSRLEKIRKEKKSQVLHYLETQRITGERASHNSHILDNFKKLYGLYKNNSYGNIEYTRTEASLARFFVSELDKFYDLLFIDRKGDIFFSIKKEDDFLSNVFDEQNNGITLFEKIRTRKIKETAFVDFEYYSASHEPASFFVAPVQEENDLLGYVVLQLPINDINTILTDRSHLGKTGEIYIVNVKELMLTQSRFIDDNTILTKKIDTLAVKNAFKDKRGNKIIEDYRSKRVFSSYEKFDYEGTTWIIIAEIDEDEVITQIYCNNEKELFEKACEYLEQSLNNTRKNRTFWSELKQKEDFVKVDFDEFQKTRKDKLLYTEGVATCTALTVSYPGKFGYLVHITPTDDVYRNTGFIVKLFLKDRYTNYVDAVMNRINRYDIIQFEKPFLRFGLFATHTSSFRKILRKLVYNNIELSQIKLLLKSKAACVDICFDYKENYVWSRWRENGNTLNFTNDYEYVPDFGEIIKIVSNYNT